MTEVNVNLVQNKYSAIFHIYQGICLKNKFFVIYHKILCKHIYVNLTNQVQRVTFFAPPQSHIWGNAGVHRSISALFFPAAARKPKSGKTAAKAAVF